MQRAGLRASGPPGGGREGWGKGEGEKRGGSAHRISVLTLAVLISYIRRTASVICRLLARVSTMKTRVLLSSIFFMADSVVSGYLRIWYWSSLFSFGTDRRENLGLRSSRSVFGRWNLGLKWTLVVLVPLVPC